EKGRLVAGPSVALMFDSDKSGGPAKTPGGWGANAFRSFRLSYPSGYDLNMGGQNGSPRAGMRQKQGNFFFLSGQSAVASFLYVFLRKFPHRITGIAA
ncbi:MAG: hypothetical protein ABJH75_17775, partial [Roseibium sp.]|uniref:hypothetical protein n=1 Tax=Roseibium sp. TaxID=1936156 RepID=UPI0032993F6A